MTETYRPQDVTVVWNGIPISGFMDGTFVEAVRNSDAFALKVGSQGEGARAATADKSGVVTLTLKQTAAANGPLSAAASLDEESGDGAGPLQIKDLSGLDLIAAETAWVRKRPDVTYSNEITGRAWAFETANLELDLGGNPI